MSYSYEQIGTVCVTFECTSEVQVGQVCQMYSDDCVSKATAQSIFDGVIVSKRDNCVAVVVRGFVTVPYTGDTPEVGCNYLLANGQGGVCAAEEGNRYMIANVDTINKTVTFLM